MSDEDRFNRDIRQYSQENPSRLGTILPVEPFLKWPGGKRWIAPLLSEIVEPLLLKDYFEPFLGGGALFFHLRPLRALLSDINPDLVLCMRSVKRNVEDIVRTIRRWPNKRKCYDQVRSRQPRCAHVAAARLIYLNHTCWGGLYRVNRRGEFNVPFAAAGRSVCDYENLRACAGALAGAEIENSDFEKVIETAGKGDVVYADPPYTTLGQDNGFIRYNERLFAWQDQERLASVCGQASSRGAFVVVSGLWHKSILALYPKWWAMPVGRFSAVSGKTEGRRRVTEVLLFSEKPRLGQVALNWGLSFAQIIRIPEDSFRR